MREAACTQVERLGRDRGLSDAVIAQAKRMARDRLASDARWRTATATWVAYRALGDAIEHGGEANE